MLSVRHVFIVNPVAGKGDYMAFTAQVDAYFAEQGGCYEIVISEYAGHIIEYTRELGRSGIETRVYACGGDGTLFEVTNGAFGYRNLSVGCVPLGSGNDFIRFFGDKSQFLNIEYQVKGSTVPIDVLKAGDEYAINQCSAGMDAAAAQNMGKFRKWPLVSGKMVYYLALFYTFFRSIRFNLTVTVDDVEPIRRTCLFAIAANAPYHGGGFKAAPEADPTDGLLEGVLIGAVSRLRVLTLLGTYRRGEHVKLTHIYEHHAGKTLRFESPRPIVYTIDGETRTASTVEVSLIPQAMDFIVPGICTVSDEEKEKRAVAGTILPTPACETNAP